MKILYYHSPFIGNKRPRVTICGVYEEDQENSFLLTLASARCSKKDHFSRKAGRIISYGRAIKAYNNSRGIVERIVHPVEMIIHPDDNVKERFIRSAISLAESII